jgi:hypothetical protein
MKKRVPEPKKPRTVPAAAVYNAKDEQWELGKRDANGKPIGKWKFWWRTTGHLCAVASYENGGKKETYTRFHPDGTYSRKGIDIDGKPAPNQVIYYQKSKNPTTELALTDPHYAAVFRMEELYIKKGLSKWKNFDAKGRRIELDGTLIPQLKAASYAKNFEPFALPDVLTQLVEFQNDVGSEMFSECFALDVDDKGLLKAFCRPDGEALASRAKQKDFLAAFLPIGSANGTGSWYFVWNDGKHKKVADMPVVAFGDEGGYHVVAENLNDLLSIVGADVEPMIDFDEVSYYRSADHEPSPEIGAFREWLEERGITPAKKPDAIVRKAQARYKKAFASWLKKFS